MSETPSQPEDDRLERFVGGPGDGVVYGPDGKPWRPGDPIPPGWENCYERFVTSPGEVEVYGPDGKRWFPGDPIPPRRGGQAGGELEPEREAG